MKQCYSCKHFDTVSCEWCDEQFDNQYEDAEEGSAMHFMKKWAEIYIKLKECEPSISEFSEMYDWMKDHYEEVKTYYGSDKHV